MIAIIGILLTVGIVLMLWGIFAGTAQKTSRFKFNNEANAAYSKKIKIGSLLSRVFPFSRKLMERMKVDTKIKDRIDAAHLHLTPVEFFNIKIILTIFLGCVAYFGFSKTNPAAPFIGFAIGYVLPDFWLSKKITQRKYEIARILPETVDLLALCVEAGLDFTTATKWVIEKVPTNPLIEELAFVLEEIKWGKPRVQALRDMAKRLNISEVSSFVQTLVQAERMGTPVSEAFAILSEDTRLQRFHRGERIAMKAPIKILIPLIFCILPVIAIIIGAPIFLQFMEGGMLKGMGG